MDYYIIGTDNCSWCIKAKELLDERTGTYGEIDLEPWVLGLLRMNNLKTIPQVFDHTGKHIGGYSDLVEHLQEQGRTWETL